MYTDIAYTNDAGISFVWLHLGHSKVVFIFLRLTALQLLQMNGMKNYFKKMSFNTVFSK